MPNVELENNMQDDIKDIPLGSVMHVFVYHKGEQSPVTYTGFDSGEGAWKEENDQVWVHQIDLVGARDRNREPYWVAVAKREDIEKVETTSFMESLASKH